jgi:hypothetical protein
MSELLAVLLIAAIYGLVVEGGECLCRRLPRHRFWQ